MQVESGADGKSEIVNPSANASQSVSEGVIVQNNLSDDHMRALAILNANIVRSANWFYWIAGLSIVNLVALVIGAKFHFVIGLGMSEWLGAVAMQLVAAGGAAGMVALLVVAGFAVAAFFAACGWFARRPSIVAFAIGMAVFALDTLIYINSGEWICVAFHAWALYALWRGVSATQQFKAIKQ
jgi:hypothetical protein